VTNVSESSKTPLAASVAAAATADAARAAVVYDDALRWWCSRSAAFSEPLAVEVWVYDEALAKVVLVRHRWRGWVPPGGAAEPAETPQAAARRELREETGIDVADLPHVAAVAVRKYHPDWSPTLGLSYAITVESAVHLRGEADQPAAWMSLSGPWDSVFPDDRQRIERFACSFKGS
jgi:8-oxo-dGTP diphosphatase